MLLQLIKNNIEDLTEFVQNKPKDTLTEEDKKIFKNINDGEISVALHHIECFKKIVENDYEYALILEDDVILSDNFMNTLNNYISQLPDIWDMLFIGDGCNMHIKNRLINNPHSNIYLNNFTRCLDSYLITKRCASIILERMQMPNYRIIRPVDLWLNDVIRNNKFNVYWSEPTIVTQGSINGTYKSCLR